MKLKPKKSISLLLSWVLGGVYALAAASYQAGALIAQPSLPPLPPLGTLLGLAHLGCAVLAAACGLLGWAARRRGWALLSLALYGAAATLSPFSAFFVAAPAALAIAGYYDLKGRP